MSLREGHSATLINDDIYFYGGQEILTENIQDDMFKLQIQIHSSENSNKSDQLSFGLVW